MESVQRLKRLLEGLNFLNLDIKASLLIFLDECALKNDFPHLEEIFQRVRKALFLPSVELQSYWDFLESKLEQDRLVAMTIVEAMSLINEQ